MLKKHKYKGIKILYYLFHRSQNFLHLGSVFVELLKYTLTCLVSLPTFVDTLNHNLRGSPYLPFNRDEGQISLHIKSYNYEINNSFSNIKK